MATSQGQDWNITQKNPQQMELSSSGACGGIFLIIFGLMFGGFPLLAFIGALQSRNSGGAEYITLIFTVIGFAIVVGGAAVLFSKTVIVLDSMRRSISITKTGLTGAKSEERSFSDVKEILYSSAMRQGSKGGSYQVWLTDIVFSEGASFNVGEKTFEEDIRRRSEMLAKFINVPMKDTTGGDESIRNPEELDMPLADRMREDGEEVEVSDYPPQGARLTVEKTYAGVRYLLPAPGLFGPSGCGILFMLVWTGFAVLWTGGAALSVLASGNIIALLFPLFGVPFILIGLAGLFSLVKSGLGREEIEIRPGFLKLSVLLGNFRTGAREVPLKEVEEVRGGTPTVSGALAGKLFTTLASQQGGGNATFSSQTGAPNTAFSNSPAQMTSSLLSGANPISIVTDKVILKTGASLNSSEAEWLYNSLRSEIANMTK